MNFLKGSLFRRNTEPEEPEPMEESGGGILAVWGSPGCGKTVTAVKIAKHLAAQKKNTVLLLCDMTAPMMPCICPPSELAVDRSLGSIFAAQHISVNLIKHNLTTLKRLPHLTMLGLRKKENEYTYAPCTKQQAEELIRGLREIVPYVVIDCSSYIANDILSAVALMEADSVLQLASCDLKSVGYLSSQLPLLGELKWDKDKQYRVASNIKPFQAADRIGQVLGSVVFRLPYSQELEEQYLAGELLADLSMKDSRAFRKEINRSVRRCSDCLVKDEATPCSPRPPPQNRRESRNRQRCMISPLRSAPEGRSSRKLQQHLVQANSSLPHRRKASPLRRRSVRCRAISRKPTPPSSQRTTRTPRNR